MGAQEVRAVRIDYVNADLHDVIRSLAAVLGLNVVLTGVPASRITLSTPAPVPPSEIGAVLESILESNKLVLVRRGALAEVLPADRAPATGTIGFGTTLPVPAPVGLVTQIVPLQTMQAEEGAELLRKIASPTARIETVPRSNQLVITDRGVNVARYLDFLRQLDSRTDAQPGLRTYVYHLKHASAAELAATLGQLYGIATGSGASGDVTSRPRVRALEDRSLSRSLDRFRRRDLDALEQRRNTAVPLLALPAPVRADSGTAPVAGALVGQTSIVPDVATNSLVVRTAPPNYPLLEETIQSLDTRPPQVLLEVLIAEVTLDRNSAYGIDWSVFDQSGSTGITVKGGQQMSDSVFAALPDYAVRVVRLGRLDVRAIIRAIASRTDVRILSTPHVVALNNEEARILVGSEVPFSQSTRTGLTEVVDRNVQFKSVGTQLTITPTINQDGYVTFRILQEVSALTQQTVAAAFDAPIITVREAETSAIVKDGSTVVIGGLIDDARQEIESGVPFLKDIPLLGALFRNRSALRARTELAIFLTPHVVFNDRDSDRVLERERTRMKESRPDIDRALTPSPPAAPPR
jgi:general secretion pathway protein D